MKQVKTNKLLCRLTLFLLSSLLCCCNDARMEYDENDSELKMVTFSVKVPGASAPKTYALTESDENEVSSIAILLFDGSGNYTYQPIYSNTVTTDPGNNKIKTFTVQVPEGTYDLMILANARTSLANVLGGIRRGDPKDLVLSKLLLKKSDKWNAVSGSEGYIPIPMWGELPDLTINGNMSTSAVSLKRMVSKIDLSLSATARDNFNLQSVRLYNYNDQGQIVPNAINWSADDNKVNAPSVPATAAKPSPAVDHPFLFDGGAITKDPNDSRGISCVNEIYTFEALAGSSSNQENNTCLVVGGFYGEETQQTYYRVDFSRNAGPTTTYLSLLRNHRYTIQVTDVKGAGHGTPEEAFNARPVNIVATVVEWNEALITDIKFDGQYLLGVSQGEFTLTREERIATSDDNTLYVTTDYPGGWSVGRIIDADGNDVNSATNSTSGWLSLSPTIGASGVTTTTQLILSENSTTQPRTAFIHLTAGRLSYIVKVEQGVNSKLALAITNANGKQIDLLEFISTPQEAANSTAPAAQSFTLNWSPASKSLFVGKVANGSFAFAAGSYSIPESDNITSISGSATYEIKPPAINSTLFAIDPFYERSSVYLYRVSDGTATIDKTLTLRQCVYNLLTDQESFYWLDGSTYTFHVRSNAAWSIKKITSTNANLLNLQASDNLRMEATGGVNTGVGTPVTFRVANAYTTGESGKIYIVFGSTDYPPKFDDITVTLDFTSEYYPLRHNGWAGSNIYWNGEELTFDDTDNRTHEAYQGVYFQWGSLWGIAPNAYWTGGTTVYPPTGGSEASKGTWDSLPRVNNDEIKSNLPPGSGKSERDRAYLYEIEANKNGNGIGDICKYLTQKAGGKLHGKKWRMPTSNEFESQDKYKKNNGSFTETHINYANASGTYSIPSGYTRTDDTGTHFFPMSGTRTTAAANNTGGSVKDINVNGGYWSASVSSASTTTSSFLWLLPSSVTPELKYDRAFGIPVRCVAE